MNPLDPPSYFNELHRLIGETRVSDAKGGAVELRQGLEQVSEILLETKASRRPVFLVGNGGSAAAVAHIQTDLCHAVGLRAMVFNDPSLLTALSNDDGYERAFAIWLGLWVEKDSVLICISSSGRSENILGAARVAADAGATIITLSGFDANNPLRKLGKLNFHVASHHYGMVELAHSCIGHYLTDAVSELSKAATAEPRREVAWAPVIVAKR